MRRPPTLVSHALATSSSLFLYNAPGGNIDDNLLPINSNLGFALAQRGFDVWLLNFRGNYYSTNHVTLDPHVDLSYWNFTFDELISYDLPTMVDHIRLSTKSRTVQYVGYSQGTIAMFGLLSTQKKYNSIVKPFIALASDAVAGHNTPVGLPLLYALYPYFYNKIGPLNRDSLFRTIFSELCKAGVLLIVCDLALYAGLGGTIESGQLNSSRVHVYVSNESFQTSNRVVANTVQYILSEQFQKFDYGKEGNLFRYGTTFAPNYELSRITNKFIASISGSGDPVADPTDVMRLEDQTER